MLKDDSEIILPKITKKNKALLKKLWKAYVENGRIERGVIFPKGIRFKEVYTLMSLTSMRKRKNGRSMTIGGFIFTTENDYTVGRVNGSALTKLAETEGWIDAKQR